MAKKIQDENGNVYVQKKPIYKRFWFIALVLIVVIIVAVQTTGGSKKEVNVNTNSSEQTQQAAKYDISDVKVESDGFSTYVTGVLKNNTDKDKSYVSVQFPAYDASGNKLGDALDNVNDLKAGATWKFKAIYLGSEKDATIKTEEVKVTGF